MAMNENGPKYESLWEQLASKKFNDIYNDIMGKESEPNHFGLYDNRQKELNIKNEKGEPGKLKAISENETKILEINWFKVDSNWKSNKSVYRLSCRGFWRDLRFSLTTKDFWEGKSTSINNLTEWELIDHILPNFQNRLKNARALEEKEKQEAQQNRAKLIQEKNNLAQNEIRERADEWLDDHLNMV